MLFDTLKSDRIIAMKNKDEVKKNLLGCLIADSSKEDKIPEDSKVIAQIKKFIMNANDFLKLKDNPQSREEIRILESYLPKQLNEADIKTLIETNGLKTVPTIMKWFKENHNGCYDGATVSKIAKGYQ